MKYKITIQEVREEKNYGDTIYEQIVETEYENLVEDIIKATNQMNG